MDGATANTKTLKISMLMSIDDLGRTRIISWPNGLEEPMILNEDSCKDQGE